MDVDLESPLFPYLPEGVVAGKLIMPVFLHLLIQEYPISGPSEEKDARADSHQLVFISFSTEKSHLWAPWRGSPKGSIPWLLILFSQPNSVMFLCM